jgi:sugar/nucleoside kinase (ribokinase family)
VKTCGWRGVEIFSKDIREFYPLLPLDDFVNTNGAGDGFAAGFLIAYHQSQSLQQCVEMGHKVACGVLKSDLSYLPKEFIDD